MNLVIIGKKAINIEDVILKTRDDVKVNKFKSIEDFIMETQSRHPVIDRIILMQDAYTSLSNMDFVLSSFSDYIQRNYPATRLITLSNVDTHMSLLANTFLSPIYAHICLERAKPSAIISIATEQIEVVKQKYENLNIHSSIEAIGEIIEEEQQEPQEVQQTVKQKKGLFGGLFGKKKKVNQNQQLENQEVGYTPIGQGTGVDEFSQGYGEEQLDINVEHQSNGEDYNAELYEDITEQYADDEYIENNNDEYTEEYDPQYTDEYNEDNSQDVDVDFELQSTELGESSNWGDSYGEWGNQNESDTGNTGNENEYSLENDSNNTPYKDEQDDSYVDYEQEEEYEENNGYEQNEYSYDYTDENDTDSEDESWIDDGGSPEDKVGIEEAEQQLETYSDKIKELGKQHVEAGKNIIVPKLDIPSRKINVTNVNAEEVDTSESDMFVDLENLEKQYEDANTKTVVKEKVVERVVEVNKGGNNTKNYKNGVRLVVVTGDRKTGVTRTALNLATLYANRDNVLYVDFDVDNHGSVAYIGIEDLVNAPEHIQNGVKHLKHERMLENLSYFSNDLKINCLTSLYGCDITDEELELSQSIIAHQTTYTTVVVDCPIQKLYLLEDILVYSEVMICVEPYINCLINTISMLDAMEDIKLSALLSRHCGYVLTKGKVEELKQNLEYVSDIFSLVNKPVNWSRVPIAGKVKELGSIAERLW